MDLNAYFFRKITSDNNIYFEFKEFEFNKSLTLLSTWFILTERFLTKNKENQVDAIFSSFILKLPTGK